MMKNATFNGNGGDYKANDILIDDERHVTVPLKITMQESSFANSLCTSQCSTIYINNVRLTTDSLIEKTKFLES